MHETPFAPLPTAPLQLFSWMGARAAHPSIQILRDTLVDAGRAWPASVCAVDACVNAISCPCAVQPALLREHSRTAEDCA